MSCWFVEVSKCFLKLNSYVILKEKYKLGKSVVMEMGMAFQVIAKGQVCDLMVPIGSSSCGLCTSIVSITWEFVRIQVFVPKISNLCFRRFFR